MPLVFAPLGVSLGMPSLRYWGERVIIRNLSAACALALVASAAPGTAQSGNSLAEDAAAFGARPAVMAPDLSADGNRVIYLTPGKGKLRVAVVGDLMNGGGFKQIAASDSNPEILRWCAFAGADRYVCKVTAVSDRIGTELVGFSRLFSVNGEGKDVKLLGQRNSWYDAQIRQFDADVLDWLGGDTGSVLLMRSYVAEEGKMGTRFNRSKSGLGVDRVDVASLKGQSVEEPRDVSSYMTDGRGNVRLMSVYESVKGFETGKVRYSYRLAGSKDWIRLSEGFVDAEDYEPLAVDGNSNQLYTLIKTNGRMALYAVQLDATAKPTLIADNPRVDVDGVVRVSDGGPVVGYTFAEEKRNVVYTNAEYKALAAALGKALPNSPIVSFVDASKDGRKLLLFAGSDVDPGRYYLFDRTAKTLTPAMIERPDLEGRKLASVEAVTIPAADGVSIPAYLTLPPGGKRSGLPGVILPHGGPSSRDEWGFDWLPQFLAARGYVVLQPQFRGSAGYGDAWLNDNGFKNWRTSIGDITASARWLSAKGIAAPDRMAILGWSYGGYAALQSAAVDPGLYKAAVAIAPVTDLAMTKSESDQFTIKKLVHKLIGTGPHVAQGSPLQQPQAFVAPVLMFHGDRDTNVSVEQSRKMDAALKAAGKGSDLVVFPGLDHQLDDSDARTQMLARIGQFLEATIGK